MNQGLLYIALSIIGIPNTRIYSMPTITDTIIYTNVIKYDIPSLKYIIFLYSMDFWVYISNELLHYGRYHGPV